MICETWAPESEKVTTARGCRIISSATSWSSLAIGVQEEDAEVRLEAEVDHGLGRVDAALARDLGHRAVRSLHLAITKIHS